MKFVPTLLAAALVVAAPAFAGSAADAVTVADPYVRLVPPGQPATGAFFVLKNSDDKDHKVLKAESSAAKVTELHTHLNEGGMMKMRPVKDIEIKAKGEAELKPGSLHVMLINLNKPLKEGDSIPLKLIFEDNSSKEVSATVRKIQAEMPMGKPADMPMGKGEMMHHHH
ncbi:MAG: copper chaperone PCu(A)C [Sulfuricella sp.]|nr:copper chaperone PCu(A)C [Sulfuricella sp.]